MWQWIIYVQKQVVLLKYHVSYFKGHLACLGISLWQMLMEGLSKASHTHTHMFIYKTPCDEYLLYSRTQTNILFYLYLALKVHGLHSNGFTKYLLHIYISHLLGVCVCVCVCVCDDIFSYVYVLASFACVFYYITDWVWMLYVTHDVGTGY